MPMPKKPRENCRFCGKVVISRPNVYCSNKCQKDHQYQIYIERWQAGLETGSIIGFAAVSGHVRRYLIEKYSEQCSSCGWNKRHPVTGKVPLEVHHVNGDNSDNTEQNLVLLCPNCHSLTVTYRNLNKGNGRAYRKRSLTTNTPL